MKKILFCICLFLVTGCYNYREIDSLGNVSTIIVHHENDEFILTFEVGETVDGENISYLIETSGLTFERASNNANQNYNKTLYFGNLDLLLLTPSSLDELSSIIRHINRDLHFSFNFNLAVTNEALELIKHVDEYDSIFGIFIRELLNNNLNNRYDVTYLNFLSDFVNNNLVRVPTLNINDDQITFNMIEVQT